MKKLKEKSLKSLLAADFTPLTQTAEGELRGGFAGLSALLNNCDCYMLANDCKCNGNNCSCPANPDDFSNNCMCDPDGGGSGPVNNCVCYLRQTETPTTSAPSDKLFVTSTLLW